MYNEALKVESWPRFPVRFFTPSDFRERCRVSGRPLFRGGVEGVSINTNKVLGSASSRLGGDELAPRYRLYGFVARDSDSIP